MRGGNTYLNLIDPLGVASIHILKGPDGSLYGANSGGVVRLQPKGFDVQENQIQLNVTAGAYGLFQEQLSIQHKASERYNFSFDQAFVRSDGYRENSSLNKKAFQTAHQWRYSPQAELRVFALYSDLGYRTPGGLTAAQMAENPRQARPAAGATPGAREQQAGIYNKTFYGGVAHQWQLSDKLTHHVSVFGSTTDFENAFMTNYEVRDERNLGMRTFVSYVGRDQGSVQWEMQLGFEGQKGWNKINNYDNNKGVQGAEQAKDKLDNNQYSFFYRAMAKFYNRWTVEGSLGLNKASIAYEQLFPTVANGTGDIEFDAIWMPRLASSFLLTNNLALRASISKGYSTPTIAEVRSSDKQVNTALDAETGTNYETGIRWESRNRRFMADLAFYSYQMDNGIIRQLDANGADFYVNAGKMDQKGIEASVNVHILKPQTHGWMRDLTYQGAVARQFYKFERYELAGKDYSGNKVTAVPDWTVANTLSASFAQGIFIHLLHNHVSSMPLNDANTVEAKKYDLLQAKAGVTLPLQGKLGIQLFVGADNLLNEKYSLGNDINAFGNRFFNPSPTRNFYGGVKLML